ncbi:MAG: T9SS type A sorting domain-containing protein, partial [Salinivirgaceae bacterium]
QGAYISSVYENQVYVYQNSSNNNYISQYSSGTFTSPFDVNFESQRIYANAMTFAGAYQDELLIISDFYGYPSGEFVDVGTGSEVPYSYVYRSPYSSTTDDVFIGTSAGQLFKAEVSTYIHSVEEITGTDFPVGYISSINMAGSQDTILVTFSNYGVNSVWLTVNGGLDWASVEGNLPDVPVRFAVFHPENSRQVMLATETGVWTTTHLFRDNVTWEICDDFPFVRTDMLDVRAGDNTLLAATHGRGLFTATWPVADYSSIGNSISSGTLRMSPNPAKVNQPVTITLPQSGMYRLVVSSVDGKVEEQKQGKVTRGETLQFTPKQSGTFFIVVMMGNKHYKSTLVVQ